MTGISTREAREASSFVKFRLLMWKNFLQQWRHRIQTTIEVLIPVITMSLVLILRWQLEPEVKDAVMFPPIKAHTLNHSRNILYAFQICVQCNKSFYNPTPYPHYIPPTPIPPQPKASSGRNEHRYFKSFLTLFYSTVYRRRRMRRIPLIVSAGCIGTRPQTSLEILDETGVYAADFTDVIKFEADFTNSVIRLAMTWPNVSIAYSPESPALEEVVRNAVFNILADNYEDLRSIIDEIPSFNSSNIPDLPNFPNFPDFPDLSNITLPDLSNITLPDINITDIDIAAVIRRFINVTPYNSSKDLRGIYSLEEDTRKILAVVEFNDSLIGATTLPHDVSYALRFPERPRLSSLFAMGGRSWRTEMLFPSFELPGPRFPYSWEGGNDPGYVNEMFIALQNAISKEIISTKSGIDLRNFTVNIQRYPHAAYVEDITVQALLYLFPTFILISFAYTAVNLVRAITVEKELQLKESMKIMGLPTWLNWTAWFFKQFIYLLLTALLIVVLLKVSWFSNKDGFSDYSVFTNTPATVLFFFLMLYLTCTIFFCFMLSGFFSKASTASLFTSLIWVISNLPALFLYLEVDASVTLQTLTCLSINSAMSLGLEIMLSKESLGGLQWGEFMESTSSTSTRFTFGHVVLMLAVDCVLYMMIALYLELVMPGPYGSPMKWYFPFQKSFWFPKSNKVYFEDSDVVNDDTSEILLEKDPNLPIGVQINNLTKVFGTHVAVNNLSLNIYDDQITVLLGHNGAGKSTTISMLTGNLEISGGSVTLAGYDMTSNPGAARAHLGLCPQHNVIFNELTVEEHLRFFARLKGFSGPELDNEIDTLIEKLELTEKRHSQAHGLSGGQKRRLCVGIALSGAAKVVLLDEPTSGMDPASRRGLWDLLQKEKKGRSMILTTHFMDEADILGDRVAIMSDGKLRCVGSPYFLKSNLGVRYTLVVVKDDNFQYEACSALVQKYIPGTDIKEDRGSEVTYSLPNDHTHIFEQMLKDLENNKEFIKYQNYGLSAATLEDVFMAVGSDSPVQADSDDGTMTMTDISTDDLLKYEFESSWEQLELSEDSTKWFQRTWQHIRSIWLKLWLVWTRSWMIALLQIFIPIIVLSTTLAVIKYVMSLTQGITRRELALVGGYLKTETLLSFNGSSITSLGANAREAYEDNYQFLQGSNADITIVSSPMSEYYLNRTENAAIRGSLRHSILLGATFDDNSVTAWFSNFGYHDVATSLANVHEALLRALVPEGVMRVANHPLEANYNSDQNSIATMVSILSLQLSSGIGNSVAIVSAFYIMFYIRERVSRAKLLQDACGIQPAVFWGSSAIFDWCWFVATCLTIPATCAAFGVDGLSSFVQLGRLYVLLLVYGASMVPLNYVLSFAFDGPALGFSAMFFINVLLGMIGAQVVESLAVPEFDTETASIAMDYILQFFPLYSLITSIRDIHSIGLVEKICLQSCEYVLAVIPTLTECDMNVMCSRFPESCCIRENPFFDWEEPGVARYLTAMATTTVVLFAVLMAMEHRLVHRLFTRERRPPQIDPTDLDEDVHAEAAHVKMLNPAHPSVSMLVKDISKYYSKNLAVDQISFSVSEGEIFGLLGVNGAGKTTTFKMLMGDESLSYGDAYVGGYSVKNQLGMVHQNIGYCPQFDAVFDELTGRETLYLFSMLRGFDMTFASSRTIFLAEALGFTKHLDKRVGHYSGGNKRKLSTAIALLGRTRLVTLDEPTTGVDPAAKRKVWRALRSARAAGRAVLLTSHSMEECEALCSRLAIMVNGRFKCLGTPQHLKNKFSQGFTLTIKMKIDDDAGLTAAQINSQIVAIKNYINDHFKNPRIMEEYLGVLTYYLPDQTVAWSLMFGIMEQGKKTLHIEDYSISQTTLEQIFLQFTKYQKETLTTTL